MISFCCCWCNRCVAQIHSLSHTHRNTAHNMQIVKYHNIHHLMMFKCTLNVFRFFSVFCWAPLSKLFIFLDIQNRQYANEFYAQRCIFIIRTEGDATLWICRRTASLIWNDHHKASFKCGRMLLHLFKRVLLLRVCVFDALPHCQ